MTEDRYILSYCGFYSNELITFNPLSSDKGDATVDTMTSLTCHYLLPGNLYAVIINLFLCSIL